MKSTSSDSDEAYIHEHTLPDPNAWVSYQRQIYSSLKSPKISLKPSEWEAQARKRVPNPNYQYVFGSAGENRTYQNNLAGFNNYRIRPHMLVDATRRDMSVELFGINYKSPILAAPVGVQSIMHKDGEEATARACREVGIPYIMSTLASRTIEEVAAANGDGDRWFQLYWPRPYYDDVTASLLRRAKANGFKVLVVTLDTFFVGWRPSDLDNSYLPFLWGEGCQVGNSDPVFNKRYEKLLAEDQRTSAEKIAEAWQMIKANGTLSGAAKLLLNAKTLKKSLAWLDVINSGTYREWEHLKLLKDMWDGPIVLKGIQTVEDAQKAVEYGMDGIVVSNHGGRQLDGAMASIDALAEIAADETVKRSGLTILFDSGIRTGPDVIKALALGAKAVLVGRPYMYGLAIDGRNGVEHVFRSLLADTDNSLGNMGVTRVTDLTRFHVQMRLPSRL